MIPFEHLHTHSHWSLLDGLSSVTSLVERAYELDHTSVAITDHGTIAGIPELFRVALEYGIKPIAGMEAYFCDDINIKDKTSEEFHLTILARNLAGYKILCKLISTSYIDGFYRHARIDWNTLSNHAHDIFVLAGCIGGPIQQALIQGDKALADRRIKRFVDIMDKNFILEVQDTGLKEQKLVNKAFHDYAKRFNVKIVATADSHYTHEEDADAHDTLLCIGTRSAKADPKRFKFNSSDYFYKTGDDMARLFPRETVSASRRIADMCESYDLPKAGETVKFKKPSVGNNAIYLKTLAINGLRARGIQKRNYLERLYHELDVVSSLGFVDYFLIISDILTHARNIGVYVGPGRGSSAGSLLAYCLHITDVDPIRFGLYFERFLNADRIAPPDIDVDISDTGRQAVLGYIRKRYGEENVAHIAAFSTLGPRAAIKDVAVALGMGFEEVNHKAKIIPHDPMLKWEDIEKMSQVRGTFGEKIMRVAGTLAGKNRHTSTHAAGIIISGTPLKDVIPLRLTKDGHSQTLYQYDDLEKMGYNKFDILGLKTLGVIDSTLKMANVDVEEMNELNDGSTYEMLSRGETIGVFQLEGWGYQQTVRRFKPRNFEDIMTINALYRPGPMQGGEGLELVLRRRNGQERESYVDAALQPILGWTYGIPIYQEQVMQICVELAGFTLSKADSMRHAIGKKKDAEIAALRADFIGGAISSGRTRAVAERIYGDIEFFARYGWNRAHAAAYGMVTYHTAYLKRNHPAYFMCALLNAENDTDKIKLYINEALRLGVRFEKCDIIRSAVQYTVEAGKILCGIASIHGVGEKAAEAILAARKVSSFASVEDFRARIPRKVLNSLMFLKLEGAGALSKLPEVEPAMPF